MRGHDIGVAVLLTLLLTLGCRFNSTGSADDDDDDVVGDAGASDSGNPDAGPSTLRRVLEFDNLLGPDLVNFPVLIVLDDTRISYGQTQPDGSDVHFTTTGGVSIPHEIESWDPGARSLLWVRVPLIPAGSTTEAIHMNYGGPPRTAPDPTDVWNQTYDLVFHFTETDAAVPVSNSASATYQGVPTGTFQAEGRVGFARGFSNPTDRIEATDSLPLFDSWPEFTLEVWAYFDYVAGDITAGAHNRVLSKGNSLTDGFVFDSATSPGRADFILTVIFSDGVNNEGEQQRLTDIDFRTWHHLAYTFDGSRFAGFVDGRQIFDIDRAGWTLRATSNLLSMGDQNPTPALDESFQGRLDELRISQIGQPDGWFDAQRRSMADVGFVSYGPEESL